MAAIASSAQTESSEKHIFNAPAYLASVGRARKVVEYRKSEDVYSQGHPANDVMYIQKGHIKLSIVNDIGKKAVIVILGPDDFFVKGVWHASPFVGRRRPQ